MIDESFKRYLVFLWDEYDNGSPIPETSDSFDSKELATEYATKSVGAKGSSDFSAILDLEKREVLIKYCSWAFEGSHIAIGFTFSAKENQNE